MSVTYLSFKVTNPGNGHKVPEKRFLVDSGAIYSVVPTDTLRSLGIKPDSKEKFILVNGEEVKKEIGEARFEFRGKKRVAPVIFGDPGVFLVGATTLENLGMILDPISRELRPLPILLM